MIETETKEIIARRLAFDDEDYINIQKCWDAETEILSRDMAQTVKFIENECDDETFYWIGEVFDDVAERTQSREFLEAIKRRAERVVDDEQRRSIEVDVRYAEYKYDDED